MNSPEGLFIFASESCQQKEFINDDDLKGQAVAF